jgi:hypothetical protein
MIAMDKSLGRHGNILQLQFTQAMASLVCAGHQAQIYCASFVCFFRVLVQTARASEDIVWYLAVRSDQALKVQQRRVASAHFNTTGTSSNSNYWCCR